MNELAPLMRALQTVADAVTRDDEPAFRAAVRHARKAGCTPEQIRDAYDYRTRLRTRSGAAPVTFPFDG